MAGVIHVVVGGQFGSEGKGAFCGWLAARSKEKLLAIRTGGPNAGHTVIGDDGREWKLRHVPVAAVTKPSAKLALAQDTEIDPMVLEKEVNELNKAGLAVDARLFVDDSATIIEPDHQRLEAGLVQKIGSTGKGIGAARAARIMREARTAGAVLERPTTDTATLAREWLADRGDVLIEASQGFGLGLHAGYYPKCTSRDCRAMDAMAGAGVWPLKGVQVWVVLRPYPIRVAGDSGPLLGETTWEELGLRVERTTVTNKVRRVGRWDGQLAERAIAANGGAKARVALTMVDSLLPQTRGMQGWPMNSETGSQLAKLIEQYERDLGGARIEYVGTGPRTGFRVFP